MDTAGRQRAGEAALRAVTRSLAEEPQAATVELSAATLKAAKKSGVRRTSDLPNLGALWNRVEEERVSISVFARW
jgi:hypothetical protein